MCREGTATAWEECLGVGRRGVAASSGGGLDPRRVGQMGNLKYLRSGQCSSVFGVQIVAKGKRVAASRRHTVTSTTSGFKGNRVAVAAHLDVRVRKIPCGGVRGAVTFLKRRNLVANKAKTGIHPIISYGKAAYRCNLVSAFTLDGGVRRHFCMNCRSIMLPRGFGVTINKYPGGYMGPGLGSVKVVNREVPGPSIRGYQKYGGYRVRGDYPIRIPGLISNGLCVSPRRYVRYKHYGKGYPFNTMPRCRGNCGVCVKNH